MNKLDTSAMISTHSMIVFLFVLPSQSQKTGVSKRLNSIFLINPVFHEFLAP